MGMPEILDMPLKWKRLPPSTEQRINEVLQSWRGTRYSDGSQVKGIGVNCTMYFGAFIDEMFHQPIGTTKVPRLAADCALHSFRDAWPTVRCLRAAHYRSDVIRDGSIEPGDVVITRAEIDSSAPRRPGHLIIASGTRNVFWHATKTSGVVQTSIQASPGIIQIYRPRRKDLW